MCLSSFVSTSRKLGVVSPRIPMLPSQEESPTRKLYQLLNIFINLNWRPLFEFLCQQAGKRPRYPLACKITHWLTEGLPPGRCRSSPEPWLKELSPYFLPQPSVLGQKTSSGVTGRPCCPEVILTLFVKKQCCRTSDGPCFLS